MKKTFNSTNSYKCTKISDRCYCTSYNITHSVFRDKCIHRFRKKVFKTYSKSSTFFIDLDHFNIDICIIFQIIFRVFNIFIPRNFRYVKECFKIFTKINKYTIRFNVGNCSSYCVSNTDDRINISPRIRVGIFDRQ